MDRDFQLGLSMECLEAVYVYHQMRKWEGVVGLIWGREGRRAWEREKLIFLLGGFLVAILLGDLEFLGLLGLDQAFLIEVA